MKEQEFISLRAKLAKAVGMQLESKIINLIRHFYAAPVLQATAYILTILREHSIDSSNHDVIKKMVLSKTLLGPATCHSLAKEISLKRFMLPVPSYCMACSVRACVKCGGRLTLWRTKSKKSSAKTDPKNICFDKDAKAISSNGTFDCKIFRFQCIACEIVYDYAK